MHYFQKMCFSTWCLILRTLPRTWHQCPFAAYWIFNCDLNGGMVTFFFDLPYLSQTMYPCFNANASSPFFPLGVWFWRPCCVPGSNANLLLIGYLTAIWMEGCDILMSVFKQMINLYNGDQFNATPEQLELVLSVRNTFFCFANFVLMKKWFSKLLYAYKSLELKNHVIFHFAHVVVPWG